MYSPLAPSNSYHFYNRGNNKENIFLSHDNYIHFIKLIEKYLVPIADIHSYCLLPNHFHLVFRIKNKVDLPKNFKLSRTKIHQPFSNLFNAYAKAFNKRNNRSGSLFQKHPKKKLITSQDYFKNLIIYVNTNPTHHLIADYSTYRYSSYPQLISKKTTFLKRDEVINLFNDKENFKCVLKSKCMDIELTSNLELEN
jgi:REP element-mobilizing transposase RayT